MNNRIERIKKHFRDNKKTYIVTGVAVTVSVVTTYLLTRNGSGAQIAQKITQVGFRNEANPVIVNLIERSTPSKPVHLVGTDLFFSSLNEAARKTGHSLTQISKCANGLIPDINGDIFELLQPAT